MRVLFKQRIKRYNVLLENIAALFSIRIFEYALSLLTIPYLVRILGPGHFGALAFAQGIVQYGVLLTDYGFNLTGPKNIAVCDSDEARARVFSAVMGGKALLCALVTAVFFLGLWLSEEMRGEAKLYACVYLLVFGNVLFPIWFFQGIQKMRYITLANLTARVFTTAGVFIFVKTREDYVVAALLQSLVPVIAGLVAWMILYRQYRYVFSWPSLAAIASALQEGWRIFLSTVAINAYTASNVVVLGLLTDTVAVGYFSAAQKIVGCVTGLLAPITQAVYPHVSRLAAVSREQTMLFLRKYMAILSCGNFLVGVGLMQRRAFSCGIAAGKGVWTVCCNFAAIGMAAVHHIVQQCLWRPDHAAVQFTEAFESDCFNGGVRQFLSCFSVGICMAGKRCGLGDALYRSICKCSYGLLGDEIRVKSVVQYCRE